VLPPLRWPWGWVSSDLSKDCCLGVAAITGWPVFEQDVNAFKANSVNGHEAVMCGFHRSGGLLQRCANGRSVAPLDLARTKTSYLELLNR